MVFLGDDLVLHLVILKTLLLVHPEVSDYFVQVDLVDTGVL